MSSPSAADLTMAVDSVEAELIFNYKNGRVDRLDFLRRGVILGMAGILLVSVLGGCMPGHEQTIVSEGNAVTTQPLTSAGAAG